MKISHIINPVNVKQTSDLYTAQPITFETMRLAQKFAAGIVDVGLYTTQYPEDHPILPDGFTVLPDLTRSVLDVAQFEQPRKLPILNDILQCLYNASDADYFIYTNVDISPMPYFYVSVAELLAKYDALVINRRTIPNRFTKLSEIPLMYTEIGNKHLGFDCFVFRRDIAPQIELGAACIGANFIGSILYANLMAFSSHLTELTDAHLTFHIGDDRVWQSEAHQAYNAHNEREIVSALKRLRTKTGPFNQTTPIGQFLLNRYHRGRWHWLKPALEADNSPEVLKIRKPSLWTKVKGKARRTLQRIVNS